MLFAARAFAAPSSLNAVLTVPRVVSSGQRFPVVLHLVNGSDTAVNGVRIAPLVLRGAGTAWTASGPAPEVPLRLAGGASATLTWHAVIAGSGTAWITASGAAVEFGSGRPMATGRVTSAPIAVQAPARLAAGVGWFPAEPCGGRPFTLVLTVTNLGEAAARGIAATVWAGPGWRGSATLAELAGGGAASFTWTATAPGGEASLTASASGTDANGGWATGASAAVRAAFPAPARLAATIRGRRTVARGMTLRLALAVTNTGGSPAEDVEAELDAPAALVPARGRPPRQAAGRWGPGDARRVTWTFTAAADGVFTVTGTARGTTCDGVPVSARASDAVRVLRPAELTAGIAVSATALVAGQPVTVRVTVSNAGEEAARVLVPRPIPSLDSVRDASGSPFAAAEALAGGGATAFSWTYTTEGAGVLVFGAYASGAAALSERRLRTPWAEAPAARVYASASLVVDSCTLLPNPTVMPGAFVTAVLVVVNRGEAAAELADLDIHEWSTGKTGPLTGERSKFSPGLPLELRTREGRAIVWSYQTQGDGMLALTVTAAGRETATGKPLAVWSRSNEVSVNGLTRAVPKKKTKKLPDVPASRISGSAN